MKNFREIELLSSYLDEQLNASESKRLETRIAADPELASVLKDLRDTRGILRKLPARKAPRNFTLTRQMVGLKPPLPRAYPVFKFSTAFAAILLVLTFAANSIVPRIGMGAAAPAYGYGMGGGGGDGTAMQEAATEAPAAAEMFVATEAPSADAPFAEMQPAPSTDNGTLREGEQAPKDVAPESALQNQAPAQNEAPIPFTWQIILLAVILLSGLAMWIIQKSASRKWQ
ncbi:MAG: hypothetical protein IH588_20065 [Anaerolineales bacterium]|nr:hypothetical protein [Anaerolineales bacterium]